MPKDRYRSDIDGLRALAVALIIGFHASPVWMPGGFIGVDVFFVISGYLITRIILRDDFSFGEFYAHRARRILPALVIVLTVTLAIGWLLLLPDELADLARNVIAATLFVPNVAYWLQSGYFDAPAHAKPLLHLWSLGVEEQFYLVWPLALVAAIRFRLAVPVVIATLACGSFAANLLFINTHPSAVFFLPMTRVWEILAGAMIVFAPTPPRSVARLSSVAGAALIAAALFVVDPRHFPGWTALLPVCGAALLIWSGPAAVINQSVLSLRPMQYLGRISYPLYLWHWPLLTFAYLSYGDFAPRSVRIGLVAASVILAAITYAIETYIRRTDAKTAAVRVVAGIGLTTALALFSHSAVGRLDAEVQFLVGYKERMLPSIEAQWRKGRCLLDSSEKQSFSAECVVEGSPLIWGDSHAAALYPGFSKISQLTSNACPPLLGYAAGGEICQARNEEAFQAIVAAQPPFVILHADWQSDHYELERLPATLSRLREANIRAIVIGPTPHWARPLPGLLLAAYRVSGQLPIRLPASDLSILDRQLETISHDNDAEFVSLNRMLCDRDGCISTAQGQPLTFDGSHLTPEGALAVVRVLNLPALAISHRKKNTDQL